MSLPCCGYQMVAVQARHVCFLDSQRGGTWAESLGPVWHSVPKTSMASCSCCNGLSFGAARKPCWCNQTCFKEYSASRHYGCCVLYKPAVGQCFDM